MNTILKCDKFNESFKNIVNLKFCNSLIQFVLNVISLYIEAVNKRVKCKVCSIEQYNLDNGFALN